MRHRHHREPAVLGRQITFGDVIDQFDASQAAEAVKVKIASYMKQFREWQIFHGGAPIDVESFLRERLDSTCRSCMKRRRDILADVVLRRIFLLSRALGPIARPRPTGWDKLPRFRRH